MKEIVFVIFTIITLAGCTNHPNTPSTKASEKIQVDTTVVTGHEANFKNDSFFYDEGRSSFEILAGNSDSGYDYQTVETNYQIGFLTIDGNFSNLKHSLIKKTTNTKTCTGCEGRERSILVQISSLDTPKKPTVKIEKDCDDIFFDSHTFKTITYGCCGAEDELEILDY
tara:strand:+ start:205 stop:711 length:507 start_codon:yes stop_codon:yes gene_type:complete